MSGLWTSKAIAAATGGQARNSFSASGLSIDTRSIIEGDLFIPLIDARDGHDFIPMAIEKGAAGVLSSRPIADVPAVEVADTLRALTDMAIAARKRSRANRIAVTGSVGKTSVKEGLAQVLAEFGSAHKSQKSFNNHWGVPLTLAGLPKAANFGVFETGMNHAGELSTLSDLVRPHIAVITKIAPAHLENFDSVDAIASAKAEIFRGAKPGGVAVLSRDDDYFDFLSSQAKAKGLSCVTIGRAEGDVIWATDGTTTVLKIGKRSYPVRLEQRGEHHAFNAAIIMAVVKALGLPIQRAVNALEKIGAVKGRGQTFKTVLRQLKITVIDESYNANPESMRAAIIAAGLKPGRRIAVLGDMKEMGANAAQFHAALLEPLRQSEFSKVITVGKLSRALSGALPAEMRGPHCQNSDEAWGAIRDLIQKNDVVLVKASNSVGLGTLVAKLKKGEG